MSDRWSDLELLPREFAERSVSDREIVLPFGHALRAIDHLALSGHGILAWEGWLEYLDGRHGHSPNHQGTVSIIPNTGESWPTYVARSAQFARETIQAAQAEYDLSPDVPGANLLFCVTPWEQGT